MSNMEKFLTPESMLTPGLAGGMTMGITNALAFQFALKAPHPAAIALILSFMFGLCVFSRRPDHRPSTLLLWFINSLVIFTVAAGSNSLGTAAMTARAPQPQFIASRIAEMVMSSAHAQQELTWCCAGGNVTQGSAQQCAKQDGKAAPTQEQAKRVCEAAAEADKRDEKPAFFRPWITNR